MSDLVWGITFTTTAGILGMLCANWAHRARRYRWVAHFLAALFILLYCLLCHFVENYWD